MQHIHDRSRSKPNPSQNQTKPDFYVIGDVQGCAEPLARLLAQIPAHADVWFCGDLINRGSDNLGVLRQVQALGSRARVILGNHDIHLLGVAAGVRAPGRSDTLDDILLSPDCEGWLNWLRQWPLAHFEHGILMVHAGVMPQWSLRQVLQHSHEARTILAGDDYIEHLKTLFGSSPNYWKNSLRGAERIRAKAVEKGLKGDAAAQTKALLAEKQPLEVVDEALIPALDIVGAKYEKGTLFLPQLLQAASAAQSAFEEIKNVIAQKGEGSASKGRIVIATVKGDVHDIGKNIVRVILENYGFEVIDLGRDVPVETVVNTVREKDVHLVGLSALMTTTLKSMEETIRALRDAKLDCKIMVGGAVLTPEYAKKIGADWYAKDAKQSADIAKEFFGV